MNRSLIILFFIIISWENYFTPKNSNPIARVNQEYLFEEDIQGLITDKHELSDSILIVDELINNWAINKILRSGAKLNEDLIQYVFIYISNTNPDASQIRGKLRRYKEQDKVLLDSISYQFISSSFDDSTWHRRNELFKTIPILNNYRYNSLKKYKFFQFKDSLGLYLIKITSLLTKGQYAPIEFVSPTLEYMIVNKRKIELVNKIKREILNNAIETNKLEIYNDE